MPSCNTIDNWVRKCGHFDLMHAPDKLKDSDFAFIVDESMMIGSEKFLPVLAVPAKHQGHPIQPEEATVTGFSVKQGWTAKSSAKAIEDAVSDVGKEPAYLITDNDSKMRKAVELSGYVWHRDVSHTMAMFMERVYKKDPEFISFFKKMTVSKKQFCMKEVAYLQPPSQRSKARFMNLADSISWALSMLSRFNTMTPEARKAFAFIPRYASFIEEMDEMVSCVRYVEEEMKCCGLSKKTIAKCRLHVCETAMQGNDRMRKVGRQILDYLDDEERLLKDDECLNNSSDIIETMFGILKFRQSPNKLYGITTFVLHLPVILAMKGKDAWNTYNIPERLCQTKMKDITQWRDENLLENLVTKRTETLKAG